MHTVSSIQYLKHLTVSNLQAQKKKEQKKQENWRMKVCNKIAMQSNFPNEKIIAMYLCDNHGYFAGKFFWLHEYLIGRNNGILIRKLVM